MQEKSEKKYFVIGYEKGKLRRRQRKFQKRKKCENKKDRKTYYDVIGRNSLCFQKKKYLFSSMGSNHGRPNVLENVLMIVGE